MSPEPKPAASTGQGWEGLNLPPEQEQAVADAAASYIASPLDTVPMPSPQLIETTYEVPVPTPHGVFGVRAWLFADGAEHITARALNDDGPPPRSPAQARSRQHQQCASTRSAPPATFLVRTGAIAVRSLKTACALSPSRAAGSCTPATMRGAALG